MLIGYLAVRLRAFDETGLRGISLFAFNFAVPVLLLRMLAQSELPSHPEWGFIVAYFAGAFVTFALAAIVAMALGRRGAAPAVFGISACFSNTTILGIPIILKAYGDVAAVPLSLIVGFHSALLFTLTTVVAEIGAGAGASLRKVLRNVGAGLITNSILWGIAGGLALNLSGVALPSVLDELAALLGAAALPTALFALGGNLTRFGLASTLGEALLLTGLKTLLHPALVYLLGAYVFALAPDLLAVAVTTAALPAGINAYLFAARYDVAIPEASSTVLISTLLSVLTLGLLLSLLHG